MLITGETGVGKEVVARLIHQRSARSSAPLVTVNCAGLPDSLLESELFGHVRGSFTGAYRDKPGLLEMAPNGTVFLDEVGEMSTRMQVVLLRFLETGEIQRTGANRSHTRVNVRLITATNRDLQAHIISGTFREDLYFRLNVIRVCVPTDLPAEVCVPLAPALVVSAQTAASDARRGTVQDMTTRMLEHGESFWTAVYPIFMARDLTRDDLRKIVQTGLQNSSGNYRMLVQLFNMPPEDYKRFLSFLRKHDCHLPFQRFRVVPGRGTSSTPPLRAVAAAGKT